MKLEDIVRDCGISETTGNMQTEISSICSDSRKATAGALFIAVRGHAGDGHKFAAQALQNGAAAILYEDPEALKEACPSIMESGVPLVHVYNSRYAEALAADAFFGHPSRRLTLVGITGTNGKTTTVTLLYSLFTSLGFRCGLLSTIANYVGDKRTETANTTSDPITINSLLKEMADSGCRYCFMEVSSIGLEQDRVSGVHFKAGIFSNITHDHLDYHKTFAEYLRCKKLFFDMLPKGAYAITNIDDKNGRVMVQNTKAKIVTYSCRNMADHTCRIIEEDFGGMQLRIDGTDVWTRLIGRHNAYNLLAVYTVSILIGAEKEDILKGISLLGPVNGRLETIHGPKGLTVIIDYAHTPDALDNVLGTLRDIGKDTFITCLFGCGGDRDRTKRPEMAAVAEKYADRIIITSDNSRTEKTADIMEDIRKGLSAKGMIKSISIEDREQAIRTAILTAPQGSIILLAGKGHETYQILGTEKRHFDEHEIVRKIFAQIQEA